MSFVLLHNPKKDIFYELPIGKVESIKEDDVRKRTICYKLVHNTCKEGFPIKAEQLQKEVSIIYKIELFEEVYMRKRILHGKVKIKMETPIPRKMAIFIEAFHIWDILKILMKEVHTYGTGGDI